MRFFLARHPALTVLLLMLLFVAAELALQTRAQLTTGRSVFTAMFTEPTRVFDPALGLNVFRPSATIGGGRHTIETNQFGFRSPTLAGDKAAGGLRVAFVGASTVFGAYTPRNDALMSYAVVRELQEGRRPAEVELFNAGLPGLGLAEQLRVLERRVLPWRPDVVVFYPGMNDISAVCRRDPPAGPSSPAGSGGLRIAAPALPGWLLSFELIRKNTLFLRPKPASVATDRQITTADIPIDVLRSHAEALVSATQRAGATAVIATLARAFHPSQPLAVQERLSTSMRYYHDCFTLTALHENFETFNAMLRAAAVDLGAPVIELAREIPPGDAYFEDATHFSVAGEAFAARHVSAFLRNLLAAPAPTPSLRAQE